MCFYWGCGWGPGSSVKHIQSEDSGNHRCLGDKTIRWNDDWLLQRWDKFTKLFHLVILSYFWMDIQTYLHDEWTALDTADICRNISVWRLTVYWFQSTAIKCLRIQKHALQRYFNGICWWIITLLQALVWFKLVCCIARYLISYIINISIFSY